MIRLVPIRRRDVFRPSLRFRSAITGRYVTRLYAFIHPHITISEKRA